jgi:hypothetical protein
MMATTAAPKLCAVCRAVRFTYSCRSAALIVPLWHGVVFGQMTLVVDIGT